MNASPSSLERAASASARAAIEFARTADGWDLALHHYMPAPRAGVPCAPVILCPGYACNRYFLDFDDRYSLARYLARAGFEAWVLELRGRGYSEPGQGRGMWSWTFDDLVRFDVPAALRHVRARCGGRRPVWIGHSMGGMVAYAALGQEPELQDAVAAVVTLASPVGFPPMASRLMRGLGQMALALPFPEHLPQRGALVALWQAVVWAPGAAEVGMNPANVDRRAFGEALRRCICGVPRRMLRQLAQWSLSGEFRSADGRVDYRAGLKRITAPTCVIAGAMDRLASPEMVRFAYDQISASRKRYREFGLRSGDCADYGHVDLIFGRRAPEEVFPAVREWIEGSGERS